MTKYDIKRHFIQWFLSIPDVDETLVEDAAQAAGGFKNEIVNILWQGYKEGFRCGQVFPE